MTDIPQTIPSYIGGTTIYISGAQPIPSWQPPEENLPMETEKPSSYRH